MTHTNSRRIALGLFLLAVGTVLLFGPGTVVTTAPITLVAVGALGLAAGALLLGTSASERPV